MEASGRSARDRFQLAMASFGSVGAELGIAEDRLRVGGVRGDVDGLFRVGHGLARVADSNQEGSVVIEHAGVLRIVRQGHFKIAAGVVVLRVQVVLFAGQIKGGRGLLPVLFRSDGFEGDAIHPAVADDLAQDRLVAGHLRVRGVGGDLGLGFRRGLGPGPAVDVLHAGFGDGVGIVADRVLNLVGAVLD